ncbi:BTB/POZ domain-containing protein, putative isoform 2 [Hibiscus syriacus]|uniref:BTB/POZ domain-containing protein, putative isoform 2 n=2 Tax=Hibiscus syriacus TaxID=106335 RepID=A0A6A3D954_HIBSY|nr:BTB/POZ domain-containing protein, putative isoform 2 [Hibiscus syriacus]
MLDSDGCKAPPSDTITLPEKHAYSLFEASHKYDIPNLQDFCERYMFSSLNASNVLEILEISDVCSNKTLKETALNSIVRKMEDVVFSATYEGFAPNNLHLGVQITREFLMDAKTKRINGV